MRSKESVESSDWAQGWGRGDIRLSRAGEETLYAMVTEKVPEC